MKELLTLDAAARRFGFSRTTFWRFRRRHRIPVITGRRVHLDDIVAAINRERSLSR